MPLPFGHVSCNAMRWCGVAPAGLMSESNYGLFALWIHEEMCDGERLDARDCSRSTVCVSHCLSLSGDFIDPKMILHQSAPRTCHQFVNEINAEMWHIAAESAGLTLESVFVSLQQSETL